MAYMESMGIELQQIHPPERRSGPSPPQRQVLKHPKLGHRTERARGRLTVDPVHVPQTHKLHLLGFVEGLDVARSFDLPDNPKKHPIYTRTLLSGCPVWKPSAVVWGTVVHWTPRQEGPGMIVMT